MNKILKRYQYRTKDGIKWTDWFDLPNATNIEELRTERVWQYVRKLINEFRVKP